MGENSLDRRAFLGTVRVGSIGAVAGSLLSAAAAAQESEPEKKWEPVSDRKIAFGIVGHGVCEFGAAFGFQDHPNVRVVAVSDLIPERCSKMMAACRCEKSYESLEVLVKDPAIEAVVVATDAASHARHCIECLTHGKHVMTAVPATWGSIEEGQELLETVKKTGLRYMMAETSCFHADCYAMRKVYQAGGFGRIVYSEGEYIHYIPGDFPSYQGWRTGCPPLWYPTHSTAYYVWVTGQRYTSVSCLGFAGQHAIYQPGGNKYNNPFADQVALFQTSEGGVSRMSMCKSVQGYSGEAGRLFGEKGSFVERYQGTLEQLPDTSRPALPPTVAAGGHGGSHGHLAHEFVMAILENRDPLIDVHAALAMTVPGIVAHQSSLQNGAQLPVPQLDPEEKTSLPH
jgi:predicted dehydrogenase